MAVERNGRVDRNIPVVAEADKRPVTNGLQDPVGVVINTTAYLRNRDRRLRPAEALHRPSDRVVRAMALQARALERLIGTPSATPIAPPRRVNR